MSEYLSRLEAAIANEPDPAKRAELVATKAAYVARVGKFDEARQLIAEIRQQFGRGQNGRVTVRLMLAEGLMHAFESYSLEGLDRIVRAQALSTAMRSADLTALTSAWRAHCQSERSEWVGMSRSLQTALSLASERDHDALSRVGMTLANAFASCGDTARANAWYAVCRHHALEAGDRATIEAFLYNKASFAMAWLRAEACCGTPVGDLAARASREMTSARNLHELEGVSAGTPYMRLWEARALLATGQFGQAKTLLEALREESSFADYNVNPALIELEIAYCMCHLGLVDEASQRFLSSARADFSSLHSDEQLVASWLVFRLSEAAEAFGPPGECKMQLEEARQIFQSSVAELREVLAQFHPVRLPGVPDAIVRQHALSGESK